MGVAFPKRNLTQKVGWPSLGAFTNPVDFFDPKRNSPRAFDVERGMFKI